ncbi:MAG TPA: hypothetical protein VF035_07685 [Longimicrobiales bacterium]
MEAVARKSALVLPNRPEGSGSLSFRSAPLRRDLLATDPFSIAGRHAHAFGRADRGIADLEIREQSALHDLHVQHSVFERGVITSLGLERTLRSGNSVVTEHAVILPDAAALTMEWTSAVGTSIDLAWRHEARLGPGCIQWNSSQDGLIVELAGGLTIACMFSVPVVALDVVPTTDRARGIAAIDVHARLALPAPGIRMHIAGAAIADGDRALDSTLASLRNVMPLTRSLAARQVQRAHAGISIASPEPGLDEAVEWAKQRIAVAPLEPKRPIDALAAALGALGANDADVARAMIGRLAKSPADYLIALAHYFAWSGDAPFVGMEWERAQAAVHELLRTGPDGEPALWVEAVSRIAAVARDVGQTAFATDLDTVVRRERIVHAATLRESHWLAAADHPATTAWLHFARGEDVRALRRLENAVARARYDLTDPARVLVPVCLGLLGLEPDATRGRIRIRPRLPDAWSYLDVRGIPIGDAAVAMRWQRQRGRHVFTFRQERGPVPLRLIFEPLLQPAARLVAAVDGVAATLDAVPHHGRMMVPVQLALDAERVITMET